VKLSETMKDTLLKIYEHDGDRLSGWSAARSSSTLLALWRRGLIQEHPHEESWIDNLKEVSWSLSGDWKLVVREILKERGNPGRKEGTGSFRTLLRNVRKGRHKGLVIGRTKKEV
jgi:hypothetical protein